MSRLRLRLGKGSPPAVVDPPQMSGIPREGKPASIWGGTWTSTPTHYRFTRYRDGVQVGSPIVQATEEYTFTWATADAGTTATATVEISANNQATWTSPIEPYYSFYPDTQFIEPAIITPDLVATRTSSATVTPVTFTIIGTIFPSYEWEIVKLNSDFLTETYRGRKPVTEYEIANLVLDLDGATGPALDPPMSALGATEILKFRLVTVDWNENGINPGDNAGLAGRWVGVSAANFGGSQFYKLAIATTATGTGGGIVMTSVELAESAGGVNLLRGPEVNVFFSAGDETPSPVGGTTYQSDHMFDGSTSTYGALNDAPGYLIMDMLIPRPITTLRIIAASSNYPQGPKDFTIGACNSAGTYSGTPVSVTGQTWSSTTPVEWSF